MIHADIMEIPDLEEEEREPDITTLGESLPCSLCYGLHSLPF
jgi:hypothetical protein